MKLIKWGVLASFFLLAASAQAEQRYGMAGCGVGALILKGKSKVMQIFAGTTNMSSFQSSAVSTGTSGCKAGSETAVLMKQESFVASNLSTLSKEMAQGEGQSLTALSETLGCNAEHQSTVNESLRLSYGQVFAAPGAVAVLNATKEALKANPALASSCRFLNI